MEEEEPIEMKAPSGVYIREGNNRNGCFFSFKRVRVLWRHMKTRHSDETEVREILACKETSEKNEENFAATLPGQVSA